MPEVVFSHPAIDPLLISGERGPLRISTGANEITWGYGLNYKTYPTYGGEVVQILSAYTDDLVVQGEVRTYREMERVYEWFLSYIQTASQGSGAPGINSFNQTPISFSYPARGWTQSIMINELPGFRYGRDVVIPQYQIKAHVYEGDPGINAAIIELTRRAAFKDKGIDLEQFGRVTAEIGFIEENPFSDPFPKLDQVGKDAKTRDLYKQLGDYYASFIPSYMQGDFNDLIADGSVPAFLGGGTGDPNGPRNSVGEDIRKNEQSKNARKRNG